MCGQFFSLYSESEGEGATRKRNNSKADEGGAMA